MLKNAIVLLVVASSAIGSLAGCGHVAGYFPDKERDYQRVQEIPMLNWPQEMRAKSVPPAASEPTPPTPPSTPEPEPKPDASSVNTIPVAPVTDAAANNAAIAPSAEAAAQTAAPADVPYDIASEIPAQAKPPSENDPVPDDIGDTSKPVVVEQIKRDGSSCLRMNVAMIRAWRAIDKALTRNSIEITQRLPEERRFTVQYDPNEKKIKDGSLWDEAVFIFKGFEINEKQYQFKLVETEGYIELRIVDDKLKPVMDTPESIKLLDILEKSIKADFAEAKK